MSGTVKPGSARGNSQAVPKGNQNAPLGNQISPVMRRIRELLGPHKTAERLVFLTGEPISNCRKYLSGYRAPNATMIKALIASEFGWAVIDAIVDEAMNAGEKQPPWHSEINNARELIDIERDLERHKRTLARRRLHLVRGSED